MSDLYDFWRRSLVGEKLPIHDGDVRPGFYRMRSKNRQTGAISWSPVAIFPDSTGTLVCQIDGKIVPWHRAQEHWTYFCRYPVTEAQWRAVAEQSESWHDQDSVVADQTAVSDATLGINSPPDDPDQMVLDQIDAAVRGVGTYIKIDSEAKSQQAQSLRSRLLELARTAEGIGARKTADHLRANADVYAEAKTIKETWKPSGEKARSAAAIIKKANDTFLTARHQQQRAAQAAAEQSMAPEAEAPVPVMPSQVRGAYGRAASVRLEWTLTKITDQDAIYRHFRDSAAVQECLEDLARKAIKSGQIVPGTEREERAVTR